MSGDKIERPTSSASSLFDKLKATTDVNPQRLSPVKDDKRSGDEKLPDHEQGGQESKEDSEYWSAREMNIESVIQKLCSEEDTGSDTAKGEENSKKLLQETILEAKATVETKVPIVANVTLKPTEDTENKALSAGEQSDKDGVGKVKGKGGRKRKNTMSESEMSKPNPIEKPTDLPVLMTPSPSQTVDDVGGVQTRNSRITSAKQTPAKRGGNGRGSRGGKAGQGSKPRNQNSESDVYEFHDDSSDDTPGKANDAAKAGQVSGTVPGPVVVTTAQQPIQQTPVNQETSEKSPQMPPLPSTSPNMGVVGQDVKEDFLSPGQAAANTRKSRRLLERDGSRSTVDDIIEDVVRNSATQSPKNSPLRQPPSPAGPGTSMVIPTTVPNVVVTQAAGNTPANRRTTRQNNLIVPEKQNLADVRKSPRAGTTKKGNKDRKSSETSVDSSSDEAKLVKLESIKVEVKSENPTSFNEMPLEATAAQMMKEDKLVVPKQEEITPIKTTSPAATIEPLPPRMQYKPIPIEKPPTPVSSTPSPKPQISSPLVLPPVSTPPVIVNLPPGSIPPTSGQKPPNTTIHLPMQQHPPSEIKVLPLPNPPTSQATAVIQHTPITIQPPISQKLPVTVSQTTYTGGPKPSTLSMPPQMQQQASVKHIPIIEQQQKQGQAPQTVVKICGPPNSGPVSMSPQQQQQQLPPGAIMTKHGPIQPQIHGPTGNLVINIPPGSVPVTQQQSPRMQTQTQHMITKQGVQILQNKQPSQSPGPVGQMIQVGHQSNQGPSPSQQQQQQQLQTQMMIHGKPVQIQGPGGYTTVFQGTKIIHQGPPGSQGPPPQVHQGPTGKQYQVQQIQLTNIPQGQPLPQGTIVTQQPIKMSKSGELQIPTQQIHIPTKQSQAHQNPQQIHVSQKGPSPQVSMPHHLVTKQGSITIQQAQTPPIMQHGGKQMVAPQQQQQQQQQAQMQVKGNMIGLHQAPQILTGAVASPPLKHSHVQSQQPIVAGSLI